MTAAVIESFVECKTGILGLLAATDDRRQRRLLKAEVARLNRAISYLYHRGRR